MTYLLPTHSASASGTLYATSIQAILTFLSGLDGNNGFPTANGFPVTGSLCHSGGKLYMYLGDRWKRASMNYALMGSIGGGGY